MQKKIIYTTLASFLSLVLVSCGSNSKEDGGNSGTYGTAGLSIVYESSSENNGSGPSFIDHYKVHATDQNGEPISNLKITASIINGVKIMDKHKLQVAKGMIESSAPIQFSDPHTDFSQTSVKKGDNLIVVPTTGRESNTYLGNWTINSVDTKLTLKEKAFNLESADKLSYIIGGEKRYLGDARRGRISLAHIKMVNAITNEKGFSSFDVMYDTALAGHTVTLGAYSNEKRRLSTGKVVGLRAGKYTSETVTVPITGGSTTITMGLSVGRENSNGAEAIIDLDAVPGYFHAEPTKNCLLDRNASDFHTDAYGVVAVTIQTVLDENATTGEKSCEITWEGSNKAFYYEY